MARTVRGIANRTMWTGDNLDIMRGMNSAIVDLIYLDPPFNSNRTYEAPIGSTAAGAAFKDAWTLDDVDLHEHGELADRNPAAYAVIDAARQAHGKRMQSYLIMMAVRLLELRRLLTSTGSMYLHCDPTASHYLKLLMDGIFGRANFRNEIVWRRTGAHGRAKRWGPIHDTLLFYSVTGTYRWNRTFQSYDAEYVRTSYRLKDDRGHYQSVALSGPGTRGGSSGAPWRDADPGLLGRHWELPPDRALPAWFRWPTGYAAMSVQERLDVLDAQGMIVGPTKQGGMPRYRRYRSVAPGNSIQDVITDVPAISASAAERTGYPTQKPLNLLDRIIKASSNPGDLVLDPFAGCATACVSAESLGRQWIGIDLSPLAATLVKTRLHEAFKLFYDIHHRTDIPYRTDLGTIPNYRTHKHQLFGKQEGHCTGCRVVFPFRNFTVDHKIPQSKGGSDHFDNLQLLCGACNSTKGTGTQAELLATLSRQAGGTP